MRRLTVTIVAFPVLFGLAACGSGDERVSTRRSSAQPASDRRSVDTATTPVLPEVPFTGDALVRVSDTEYLDSTAAGAGTGLELRATVSEILVSGENGAPALGPLDLVQLVGIDLSQTDEQTLLQEQRMFDVGSYEEAYLVLSATDPEDRQLHEVSAWTLRSSFEIDDGDLHFLGAGYNMDPLFEAVRAAAAGVVPLSTSDLDFTVRLCQEAFGLTAERPITVAIDAARAAAIPSTTNAWSDVPGVAGPGRAPRHGSRRQRPELAEYGSDQFVRIGAPDEPQPLTATASRVDAPVTRQPSEKRARTSSWPTPLFVSSRASNWSQIRIPDSQ